MEAYHLDQNTVTYFLAQDEPILAFTSQNQNINFHAGDAIEVRHCSSPLPSLILVEENGQIRLKRLETPAGSQIIFPPCESAHKFLGQATNHVRLKKWLSEIL